MRRVPGLRREEVAMLAGVSADHYTRGTGRWPGASPEPAVDGRCDNGCGHTRRRFLDVVAMNNRARGLYSPMLDNSAPGWANFRGSPFSIPRRASCIRTRTALPGWRPASIHGFTQRSRTRADDLQRHARVGVCVAVALGVGGVTHVGEFGRAGGVPRHRSSEIEFSHQGFDVAVGGDALGGPGAHTRAHGRPRSTPGASEWFRFA